MKTFDKKDVYSWSNAKDAKQYIGKDCYFADKLDTLKEKVNKNNMSMLQDVLNPGENYVQNIFCSTTDSCWGLCLPADKVIEVKEKKWRAFTLEEFLDRFSIGTKISFRRRDITRSTYGLFEGYQTDIDETETYHKIIICNLWYTLDDLFEKYEYLDEHGEWKSFGVEE